MKIQSNDLPQADKIISVVAATVAVFNGARTDIDIANQVPGIIGDSRQGRYYRRAAEMLGFITNVSNNSTITAKGAAIAANPTLSNPVLLSAVLNLNLYQKLLPYFELHPQGITRQQTSSYLQLLSAPNIGAAMISRRLSTIIAWIKSLGIISQSGNIYQLSSAIIPSIPIISFIDIEQPILPTTGSLQEYASVQQRTSSAGDIITIYKNQAKLDRANANHKQLVNLVAERIRQSGAIPKSNQIIDLAATLSDDYIFEMKSTNEKNVKSQIRKGVSQLYEYRYIQNKPSAKLILVVQKPLTVDHSWMIDYLENDRNIHLVWDGSNTLFGTTATKSMLSFLNLQ